MDPLDAALAVADEAGLDAADAVVLRSLGSTLVHLRPSAVVARVGPAADLAAVRRQVAVTAYLAARGAPVTEPSADAGPHRRDGLVVTLWQYVEHDDERPLDGRAAGELLRRIHDLLRDYPHEGLPHFARLEEVRAVIGSLELTATDAEDLAELVALAELRLAQREVALQPVHGDAWLGNVLRTPEGPVWSDFEAVCLGPRELDLACNETATWSRGRTPADDDFLAGYGEHDAELLDWVEPLELVPLTAWTYRLAATRAEYLEAARTRLTRALDRLRR